MPFKGISLNCFLAAPHLAPFCTDTAAFLLLHPLLSTKALPFWLFCSLLLPARLIACLHFTASQAASMSNDIGMASEQVCYVHCNFCNTILAVSVPCSSLFNIVTVRCGHCTNLLPVNMAAMLQPQNFVPHDYMHMLDCSSSSRCNKLSPMAMVSPKPHEDTVTVNRPPEKRQRVPSAYNQFIKEEIQRIKASNPDISHREAFSTAAKNWAHFPHIHFGLMLESNRKDKFDEGGNKLLMTKAAVCNK